MVSGGVAPFSKYTPVGSAEFAKVPAVAGVDGGTPGEPLSDPSFTAWLMHPTTVTVRETGGGCMATTTTAVKEIAVAVAIVKTLLTIDMMCLLGSYLILIAQMTQTESGFGGSHNWKRRRRPEPFPTRRAKT